MKTLLVLVVCLVLTACSQTVPVSGKVDKTNERFMGIATANIVGEGTLLITTDSDVTCQSEFKSVVTTSITEGIASHGQLHCSDGRTGHFTFSGTADQGSGFGTLSDGHKFTFVYGATVNVSTHAF